MDMNPGSESPSNIFPATNTSASDAASRKARKPYTISKIRENWSEDEHQKFLEALKLYDRDWKRIEKFIGTKTVIQIRSHAQKYFLKVQKSGTGEKIPPPRPKRKSSQGYAPKNRDTVSVPWVASPDSAQVSPLVTSSAAFGQWMAANGLLPSSLSNSFNTTQAVDFQRQQQEQLQLAQQFLRQAMTSAQQNLGNVQLGPHYAKIYSFLGSLFEDKEANHLASFNELSALDKETLQLLMQNLAANISSPQFKEQLSYLMEQYQSLTGKQLPSLSTATDAEIVHIVDKRTTTTSEADTLSNLGISCAEELEHEESGLDDEDDQGMDIVDEEEDMDDEEEELQQGEDRQL